jgi:hypothetical protein
VISHEYVFHCILPHKILFISAFARPQQKIEDSEEEEEKIEYIHSMQRRHPPGRIISDEQNSIQVPSKTSRSAAQKRITFLARGKNSVPTSKLVVCPYVSARALPSMWRRMCPRVSHFVISWVTVQVGLLDTCGEE